MSSDRRGAAHPRNQGRDDAKDPGDYSTHPRVLAAKRRAEPEVTFTMRRELRRGCTPRTAASETFISKVHRRHVAAIQFDVLSENGDEVLCRLTWFLNLGNKDKPNASRKPARSEPGRLTA